ncbi:MAG: helix-turn-helix transcriptional regulator [Bdellovibrio sp.]|nr:helix-turn-helix transcriptional regulator [Bdellovibrio sp.]
MSTKSLSQRLQKIYGRLTFGSYLRSARTMQDKTQKDMADFLGIPKSMLCDIEKGRQIPSIYLAVKMIRKCKLPEIMAVKYIMQDQLYQAGLKFDVQIKKVA